MQRAPDVRQRPGLFIYTASHARYFWDGIFCICCIASPI